MGRQRGQEEIGQCPRRENKNVRILLNSFDISVSPNVLFNHVCCCFLDTSVI